MDEIQAEVASQEKGETEVGGSIIEQATEDCSAAERYVIRVALLLRSGGPERRRFFMRDAKNYELELVSESYIDI